MVVGEMGESPWLQDRIVGMYKYDCTNRPLGTVLTVTAWVRTWYEEVVWSE
jgi:hypothetical protein